MKVTYFLLFLILLTGCVQTSKWSLQEKYLEGHPEVVGDEAQAVRDKTVTFGLDKSAVRTSLGVPKKVFGYINEGKQMEVWVYSEFEWHPYENVLFENGKVKSWNFPKSVKLELEERAAHELLTAKSNLETVDAGKKG